MQKNGLTFGVKREERSSMEAIMACRDSWPVGWFFSPVRKVNGTISGCWERSVSCAFLYFWFQLLHLMSYQDRYFYVAFRATGCEQQKLLKHHQSEQPNGMQNLHWFAFSLVNLIFAKNARLKFGVETKGSKSFSQLIQKVPTILCQHLRRMPPFNNHLRILVLLPRPCPIKVAPMTGEKSQETGDSISKSSSNSCSVMGRRMSKAYVGMDWMWIYCLCKRSEFHRIPRLDC